jgi:hypothetical protein
LSSTDLREGLPDPPFSGRLCVGVPEAEHVLRVPAPPLVARARLANDNTVGSDQAVAA